MKDRIQQIMIHEGMNQQEFSRATGIAPASLSSIFTGRTSPTLKHAEALHRHFPQLNMSWLLFGDGEMIVSEEAGEAHATAEGTTSPIPTSQTSPATPPQAQLFTQEGYDPARAVQASSPYANMDGMPVGGMASAAPYPQHIPLEYLKKFDTKPRRISEIRIFFDDGTFEVFQGNI